jgi:cell division protein FtsL
MAQAATTNTIEQVRAEEKESSASGMRYPTFIFVAMVLMFVALIYVGSHTHMMQLEYKVAAELNAHEQKLEEQRRLKLELAMLKSPQRIESIARNRLQMSYPEREQVIVLKNSGE